MRDSADTYGGWKNHFKRLSRWRDRVEYAYEQPEQHKIHDVLDFILAYFVWCHSLREWAINSKAISRQKLDWLLHEYVEWEICRDIANRQRHFEINRKPRDKDWSVGREYNPFNPPEHRINIFSGNRIFEARDLVRRTHQMWDEISRSFSD